MSGPGRASIPSFIKWTPDLYWGQIKTAFRDQANFVRSLGLEGKEEAVDWELTVKDFGWSDSDDKWDGKEGVEYRHPDQIPYRRSHDYEELEDRLAYAREVLPKLEELFETQVMTPEFLNMWGNFEHACGFIHSCYFALDDLGEERRSLTNKLLARRRHRWFSRVMLAFLDAGWPRKQAENEIAQVIQAIITSRKYPTGFGRKWYSAFVKQKKVKVITEEKVASNAADAVTVSYIDVNTGAETMVESTQKISFKRVTNLAPVYNRAHVSVARLKALAGESAEGLPPLIPVPSR